jgi:hypothetical protein
LIAFNPAAKSSSIAKLKSRRLGDMSVFKFVVICSECQLGCVRRSSLNSHTIVRCRLTPAAQACSRCPASNRHYRAV